MATAWRKFDRYARKRSEIPCNHAIASDKIALSVHKKPNVSPSISRFFIFIVCSAPLNSNLSSDSRSHRQKKSVCELIVTRSSRKPYARFIRLPVCLDMLEPPATP